MAPVLLHCAPCRGSPLTPGGGAGVDAPCPAPVPEPHRGPGHCGWGRPHRPVLRRPVRRPDPHLPPCNPRKAAAMNSCNEIAFFKFYVIINLFWLNYTIFIIHLFWLNFVLLLYSFNSKIYNLSLSKCALICQATALKSIFKGFAGGRTCTPWAGPTSAEKPHAQQIARLPPRGLSGTFPFGQYEKFWMGLLGRSTNLRPPPHFSRVNPPTHKPPGDCMVQVRAWTGGGLSA